MVNMMSAGIGGLAFVTGIIVVGLGGNKVHQTYDPPRWEQRAPVDANDILSVRNCRGQQVSDCSLNGQIASLEWQEANSDINGGFALTLANYMVFFGTALMLSGVVALVGGTMENKVAPGVVAACFWMSLVFGVLAFGYAWQYIALTRCSESLLPSTANPAPVEDDPQILYTCQCKLSAALNSQNLKLSDKMQKDPAGNYDTEVSDLTAKTALRESYICDIGSFNHAMQAFSILGLIVNVLAAIATTCMGGGAGGGGDKAKGTV